MAEFTPLQEDNYTAVQAMQLIARTGTKKARIRLDKFIYNSILAGPLIGFGCAASLIVGDSPWFTENAPGVIQTISGMVFPIGLVMISLTGAELWTSTIFYTMVAFLERKISLLDMAKTWGLSYIFNLGGILFFLYVNCIWAGVFATESLQEYTVKFAVKKAQTPEWHSIFLSGIGANWLVCIAVLQSTMARDVASKIIAIWWPIFIFVHLGMNHVIANMFLVPVGMYYGAPFGVGYYIWKSMIPACLGNIVGGAGFVGVSYWYLNMTADEAAPSDFDSLDRPAISTNPKAQRKEESSTERSHNEFQV